VDFVSFTPITPFAGFTHKSFGSAIEHLPYNILTLSYIIQYLHLMITVINIST
jgi:hypothetical protein